MTNNKKQKFAPPVLGGSSLIVIFAVLCLTVFALLSLSTVRADARLADSATDAVRGYYQAELEAQRILSQLRCGELPAQVEEGMDGSYNYSCPISQTQQLTVSVLMDMDGSYQILRWQANPTQQWTADESMDVWDGEILPEE